MHFSTIFVGALVVEACMNIILTQMSIGTSLTNWYKDLKAIAVIMDVISLAVGTWLGLQLTKNQPWYIRAAVIVLVQLTHDIVFSILLPHLPSTPAIRLFRSYANEVGLRILFYDAILMLSCFGVSHLLESIPDEHQYVVGAIAGYVALLMLPITK